jgi:hypothetical protein
MVEHIQTGIALTAMRDKGYRATLIFPRENIKNRSPKPKAIVSDFLIFL